MPSIATIRLLEQLPGGAELPNGPALQGGSQLRDHVFYLDTAQTFASLNLPFSTLLHSIRVTPNAATDDLALDRITATGTFEELWRYKATNAKIHESTVHLRLTHGFRLRFTSGNPTVWLYGTV